ncbi:MAG: ThuA domain-containing protein [Pseudomonadota bacterium]
MVIRIIKVLLVLLGLLVMSGLAAIWYIGAWNIVFPSQQHDVEAPPIPDALVSPALLVFTKTNGFRHKEGINVGVEQIGTIAAEQGWNVFHTENGAVFNAIDLSRFDVVVFLNASGDMLNSDQELAFSDWLWAGGGWLGVHAAGDDSHRDWTWYIDTLIGARFTAHIMGPQFQTATVVMENPGHPVVADIPDTWEHTEEWYSWSRSPRETGFTILATVDENSYTPVQKFAGSERDLRMGDHPVVWSNCVGRGRSVYLAMGHKGDAFLQPQVRQLIVNAVTWMLSPADEFCPQDAISSAR